MTPGDAPPSFHGSQDPLNTQAALAAYDAGVPVWGIGEVDAAGRWIPAGLPGLLVIAPHPDDEVLGAAALIAAGLRSGSPVRILAVTDGTGSHPPDLVPTEQLAQIRTAESEAALAQLRSLSPGPHGEGGLERRRLKLPDGELSVHSTALTEAIGAALQDMPRGTLLAAPLSHDGHPDHDACGEAATAAAAQHNASMVQYPVWLWLHSPLPRTPVAPEADPAGGPAAEPALASAVRPEVPWDAARCIPIDAELAQARGRAVVAFISQLGTELGTPVDREPGEPVLTESMLNTVLRDQQIIFPGTPLDFEGLHARGPDPWGVTSRWYEQRKYALTMAMLPRARYARGFEPGCSIGGLTELLAQRCDEVLATDISSSALTAARARVVAKHVRFRRASIEDWPDGQIDLILISELAYYLSGPQWAAVLRRARQTLPPGGHLVSVHWRHPDARAFRSAQQIRADLRAVPGWALHGSYEDADMLIDVLGPAGPSVAQAEFLD